MRLLGRSRAIKYLYDGALVGADEALVMGLVDVACAPGSLRGDVQSYAEGLAVKPAGALAASRRCINIGGGATFDEGLAIEFDVAVGLAGAPVLTKACAPFWKSARWSGGSARIGLTHTDGMG